MNSAFPSRKMRDCELAHTFCFWKLFRTFTGKMTRGLSLRMVFSLLFQDTLFFVDAAPGRSPSGEHVRRSKATDSNIRGVKPFSRSSTQAALLICSARGENRAHELLHLLLRSRPLGCSCDVARRCFLGPLAHPEVLAPVQSRIPAA